MSEKVVLTAELLDKLSPAHKAMVENVMRGGDRVAAANTKAEQSFHKVERAVERSTTASKGHLEKFAFTAEGFTTKLARSFSLVDIAVGVAVAGLAAGAATWKKTNDAYLASSEAMADGVAQQLARIKYEIGRNDIAIGKSQSSWALFWASVSKGASDATAKIVEHAKAAKRISVPGQGSVSLDPNDTTRIYPNGDNASVGQSSRIRFPKGWHAGSPMILPGSDAAEEMRKQEEAWWQARADASDKAATDALQIEIASVKANNARVQAGIERALRPFGGRRNFDDRNPSDDPTGSNKSAWQYRSGYDSGREGEFGAYQNVADAPGRAMSKADAAFAKSQKYVDALASSTQRAFSGMLFDGMRLSDGLKGIFRSMVDSILGELSAQVASSIVKAVIKLAVLDTGTGVGGGLVQVPPAAVRSTSASFAYERARGR